MPVRVRTREPGDMEACVDALARVHEVGGYPTNWPTDPAGWLTPSDLIEVWVADTPDTPIAGHMVLSAVPSGDGGRAAAEVGRLFVDPAARRQGVARALISHAMDWAITRDMDLTLWVTDHLKAARTLYAQAGFRLTATEVADWTTPDGQAVTVHRYDWYQGERDTPRNR